MTRARTATVGTVSYGTLRTEDLLRRLALELGWLSASDRTTEESKLIADAGDVDPADHEQGGLLIDELISALSAFAPEGFYFGAHVGDGSDFGFWPEEDDQYR